MSRRIWSIPSAGWRICCRREPALENEYTRLVGWEGNLPALKAVEEVFRPVSSLWRGLGEIGESGYGLKEEFAPWDAARRFGFSERRGAEPPGCRCGQVIRGVCSPEQCPLFGGGLHPFGSRGALHGLRGRGLRRRIPLRQGVRKIWKQRRAVKGCKAAKKPLGGAWNMEEMDRDEIITLDYGSGGLKTSRLIQSVLVPALRNPALEELGDGAVLENRGSPLVFSTDSFVVSPWRFPGGDIGKLAVCGTVNDICMAGGEPLYLSLACIIEEGFSMEDFRQVVRSIGETARLAGVQVVTGDTKVVERGKGDGLYINTSGVGFRRKECASPGFSPRAMRPGDDVIVSGTVGCHGAAVMMARGDLPCQGPFVPTACPFTG